jgi:hypothetical protein
LSEIVTQKRVARCKMTKAGRALSTPFRLSKNQRK